MYTSCHFRSVIRPVVLWVPGTSFLCTSCGHRLSRAPSPPADSPAARTCQPPCTKWKCVPREHPPGRRAETWPPGRGNCVWSRSSPHSLWPALSCKKSWFVHLFSLSGVLGPLLSLLGHQWFLGKTGMVDRNRSIEVEWLSSFTEKF